MKNNEPRAKRNQPFSEICGLKYGRLKIIDDAGRNNNGQRSVIAECDCGVVKKVLMPSLKNGSTLSCGCLMMERIKEANTKHGLSQNNKIYKLYRAIKTRCYNGKVAQYKDYGGRGIMVCNEWMNDFVVFYKWAINNGWKEGLDIDRINNNGNYEPSNCRFVSRKINSRNRRSNNIIHYNGEDKTVTEWCEIFNINFNTVISRMKQNWDANKIFTTPLLHKQK